MARYTATIIAELRQHYVHGNEPLHSIAAQFQIGTRSLQRLATEQGWPKRSERVRDLPDAMQLLERAKALPPALPAPKNAAEGDQQSAGADTPSSALSAADEIEALVREKVAVERAAQAAIRGHARGSNAESERSARTLATLARTLEVLARIRSGLSPENESPDDDDMPLDLEEFRFELARRIDAFVKSRTEPADGDGTFETPPLEKVR